VLVLLVSARLVVGGGSVKKISSDPVLNPPLFFAHACT